MDHKKNKTVENNSWYNHNDSETVIIFVHGFLSNSNDCWHYKTRFTRKSVYWPELILEDNRLDIPSIYMAGFYTGSDANDYDITACSQEIHDALNRPDAYGKKAVLCKQNILFICHSLGGVVVRKLLTTYYKSFQDKNVGLILLASPSLGSSVANYAKYIGKFFGNDQLKQLLERNPHLLELDDSFINLINEKKIPNFLGVEGFENHTYLKLGPFKFSPKIVTKESACRYFESRNLRKTDHSSIARPDSKDHPSHQLLVDFWQSIFKPLWDKPSKKVHQPINYHPVDEPAALSKTVRDILFDRYSPSVEKYYLPRKDIDDAIAGVCKTESLWVSGPSGVGKTCSIQKFVANSQIQHLYIPLANCLKQPVLQMFNEILLRLHIRAFNTTENFIELDKPKVISAISRLLNTHFSNNRFILFIEEIPLVGDDDFVEFFETISALLKDYMQYEKSINTCFIFSSINSPQEHVRSVERLHFIKMKLWTINELKLLINLICENSDTRFTEKQIIEIISKARGSPRFVKRFIRSFIFRANSKPEKFDETLAQTESDLWT